MTGMKRRRLLLILSAATAMLSLMPGISKVATLPKSIVMREGSALELPASTLMRAMIPKDGGLHAIDDADTLTLTATDEGDTTLSYALLGLLPIKTVNVTVAPERRLIPGGQSVGIAIDTKGVIVVGASDLGSTPSPAREAGIRGGDVIQRVNGRAIESAEALSECIDSGSRVTLDLLRGGRTVTCSLSPAKDNRDGQWRIGAWVRDSTAGVGTMTFIDPATGMFGALGHAITDVDTSVIMPVGVGELYENTIVDVTPSRKGKPGELTGDFVFHANTIGTVEHNSEHGIFGHYNMAERRALYPNGLPVAQRAEVHAGAASLLTTIDGEGPREYACEVVRTEEGKDMRSMVIRITDPGLLEKTGGIVQGMSGSPILQDGRIIGAVTHVMINDPTKGYGIQICDMLEEAGIPAGKSANKAG